MLRVIKFLIPHLIVKIYKVDVKQQLLLMIVKLHFMHRRNI